MKKTLTFATTVLATGALLVGCGSSSSDWDGTWSGDITATNPETGGGTATVTLDGGKCSWEMTETSGETNSAKCKHDGDEFKFADPLAGMDMKYAGQISSNTLTLTPKDERAEKVGVMVLTRSGDK